MRFSMKWIGEGRLGLTDKWKCLLLDRMKLTQQKSYSMSRSRQIYSLILSHLYLQFLGWILPQQVPDLLVVDLDVAHPHVEHRVVVLLCVLPLEYMDDCAGY